MTDDRPAGTRRMEEGRGRGPSGARRAEQSGQCTKRQRVIVNRAMKEAPS